MPVPFTTLMQETWDEAIADMDTRESQLADSWRMALDAAHDGLEAMRDIWPRRASGLVPGDVDKAERAVRAFEQAWLDVIGMAESTVSSDFSSAPVRRGRSRRLTGAKAASLPPRDGRDLAVGGP